MDDSKYIKKLNDFISYDYRYEKFIIEEHTIKIPSTSFSFKRMNSKKKGELIDIMKDLSSLWVFYTGLDDNKTGLKNRILDFVIRNSLIKNEFDFIEVFDKWLRKIKK